MVFNDLREFIKQADDLGECRVIKDADPNLEIGYITELGITIAESPLLLFDNIKGYPPGYRIVTNACDSPSRAALACGFTPDVKGLDLVRAWRGKSREGTKLVPPMEVKTGPAKEHVHVGSEVDLFEFPTPKWHELDGGQYIGTGDMVIMKDPDTGWINFGTYRVQVHDKSVATIHIVSGHHGDIIARKYWDRGLGCPTAVVCGEDPLLFTVSSSQLPLGLSEYEYAGWLRNKPVDVLKGETVDLPIPAAAEIVLEGEFMSPEIETRIEGPFGEWEGYYSGGARPHPVFKVKAVLHRDDPIMLGAPPLVGPFDLQWCKGINRSATLWDELDKHVPGVKGVWYTGEARVGIMAVISLKQQYPGHAKQAAMIAAGASTGAHSLGKYIVIVDEDIDPSNLSEVTWAIATRCDPETSIDIVGGRRGMASDPRLEPEKRERGDLVCSTAIVYACKPYSWKRQFPQTIKSSPEVLGKVEEKWGNLLRGGKK